MNRGREEWLAKEGKKNGDLEEEGGFDCKGGRKKACQQRRKSRGRSRGRLSGKNILNLRRPHLLMSGIFSIDL